MKFLRLEVYEKNELVFVREKPVFAKTAKGIHAAHTRLINWANREFPEFSKILVHPREHPRAAIPQPIDFKGVTSP